MPDPMLSRRDRSERTSLRAEQISEVKVRVRGTTITDQLSIFGAVSVVLLGQPEEERKERKDRKRPTGALQTQKVLLCVTQNYPH